MVLKVLLVSYKKEVDAVEKSSATTVPDDVLYIDVYTKY